jgi:hypothetical protein
VTRRLSCLLLSAPLILAGCGLRDPYAQQAEGPAPTSSSASRAAAVAVPLNGPARSATDVLAQYATVWVNWTAGSLDRQRAGLLTLAAGPLDDELRHDAAEATKTQLEEVSNAYSRGRYVGSIPQAGQAAIVVTYEEVSALGGQAQATYRVYLVRTARTAEGWRVTQWQPVTDG